MSSYLKSAKQLVAALDKARYQKSLANTSDEFQHVFQLLTLLLNFNNPSLPGFVSEAPAGIVDFKPSRYQLKYLKQLFIEQHWQTVLQPDSHSAEQPPIRGVYAMGSTGSITQNSQSDLDIWVCHQPHLSSSQRNKLLQKTLLIHKWALGLKIEVNFYLLDENHFRNITYSETLSTEHCGSSQYMLLLDEFYRSVIRLAGKPLLWLHLPVNNEEHYDKVVEKWVREGKIRRQEWVDFGGLGKLSADEYFGATLWHLFKAIDSPHKSAIKVLLLEALMAEYPQPQLISKQFKQQLLAGTEANHHFDPYLAMLQQVSAYLQRINDFHRLDLLRRCFYIKANRDFAGAADSDNWRYQQLQQLIADWHWSKQDISQLNSHADWKIKQVKTFYHSLVGILMQGYRNLITFARKQKISADLMPEDISILTRKLYTAFEVLPEKVTLFNREIAENITEKELMFVEVRNSSAVQDGWHLINCCLQQVSTSSERYVEYAPNLSQLVAWAYFNGLLGAKTHLYVRSQTIGLSKIQQFVTDLRLSFTQQVAPPSNDDLSHPCELRNLFVAINLSHDPTELIVGNQRREVLSNDLFNFGPKQQSLVGSIDLIYRNRWNEIRTLHFAGEHAILNCLKVLAHKVHRGANPLESVQVFCYSKRYRAEMLAATEKLIKKCINTQVGTILNKRSINRLQVAGKIWNFSYETRGLKIEEGGIVRCEKCLNEHVTALSEADTEIKHHKYHFPLEIGEFASEGFLQFFFEDNSDGSFNVYILDEYNNPEVYYRCHDEKQNKIREINKIYTMSRFDGKERFEGYSFNYPQFYQLITTDVGTNKVVPFHSQQHLQYYDQGKVNPIKKAV
ncbi:adenylate cyclase [Pasteurella testudinis DSM 23072]|uniref:Adenylate cyclase n=1 Tax=Pasteurella testudinis DSM 23072 TaxID=1122938 RepID=A0A1W1UGJ6_9PAST|nr:class I adenylate cyclase [Pasteurella testudinis]SMB80163.1 adenylate cyclase [Pasteurella testudinis DSM 23072]SUB50584.1 adenylate cyclase [Pasteurella testudinis]